MRAFASVLLLCLAIPAAADDRVLDTEFLRIHWQEDVARSAVDLVAERGDEFAAKISELLDVKPERKIPVHLEGWFERPDGRRAVPHVDAMGRVMLYQFAKNDASYTSALAHELVHAFRIVRRFQADWFFEEAFAEYISQQVDDSLAGFPWYGFPVNLVAGQWLTADEAIPLAELRARHRELNLPCKAQAYSLRASFFLYLGATYGRDPLLAMAAANPSGGLDDYSKHFEGKSLEELEADWLVWLREAAGKIDDFAAQAERYRTQTPVQWFRICRD